jgi:hypothetical protein
MPANWRYVQRIAGMARSYVFWGLWVCFRRGGRWCFSGAWPANLPNPGFRRWSYDVGAGHARESTMPLFSEMVI